MDVNSSGWAIDAASFRYADEAEACGEAGGLGMIAARARTDIVVRALLRAARSDQGLAKCTSLTICIWLEIAECQITLEALG